MRNMTRKRAGVIALLTVVIGAAGLMTGTSAAHAAPATPCNDDSFPKDVLIDQSGVTFVGTDVFTNPTFGPHGVWVCVAPVGGEPAQDFVVATVHLSDPVSGNAGGTVEVSQCGLPSTGAPGGWGCFFIAAPTGANIAAVSLVPAADAPLFDGNGTSGASSGSGAGTCVYANGTAVCPLGATAGGASVNEADVIDLNTPGTGCIGINSICLVNNTGVGVGRDGGSTVTFTSSNPTVGTHTVDAPSACVEVGAPC